jgi:molybdate transport system substrate-binding protein
VKHLSRSAAAAALLLGIISGCSSPNQASSPSSTSTTSGGKVIVFAAASLKKSFTDIGEQFKTDNPGSDIEFNFAGSSDLVTQLTQGAPGDVFASADTKNMDKAAQAGLLAGDPVNFASNTLTIVVAPGNPKRIASFKDLAQPGLSVVVCAPQVPCGSATQKVEKATGVQLNPASEESQVTDVLNKVTTGQADAGLVYVTDAQGAGNKVTAVAFPEAAGAVNTYPIAVLKQTKNPESARKFVDLVTGEAGQKILSAAGFAKPQSTHQRQQQPGCAGALIAGLLVGLRGDRPTLIGAIIALAAGSLTAALSPLREAPN